MGRKSKKGKVHKFVKEELSPKNLKSINSHGLLITTSSNADSKLRYSRKDEQQRISFVAGFDLLQYNIVIKDYIIKKYRLKNSNELDVLLYLFPIHFFYSGDFKQLPTNTLGYSFKALVELGFVVLLVKGNNDKLRNVYGLSEKSKRAVKNYYMFLSGERTLGDNSYIKPFAFQENTKVNAERRALMLKLKRKSENFPSVFTKGSLK
jgi:hypothetical protein